MKVERLVLLWLSLVSTVCSANCTVSVQDMLFGNYDPSSPVAVTSTAEYTVDCRSPVMLSIEIGSGNSSGSVMDRRMQHEQKKDVLSYNLYTDSSMTMVWGEGAGSKSVVRQADRHTSGVIYGRIRPGQDVYTGNYSDSVRLTVLP